MWGLLTRRTQALIVGVSAILVAAACEGAWEWWSGASTGPLRWASMSVTIVVSVLGGAASMLWRRIWRWFPVLETKIFPDLNGTWAGTLVSTWADPKTKQSQSPINATIYIRQSLFSTSVQLRTPESRSWSTRCLLEADREGQIARVWYSYDNRPKAQVLHQSPRHEGVAWLEMDLSADPNRLVGQYYTHRRTTGDMDFHRRSRSIRP